MAANKIDANALIEALDSVTWYNGLAEELVLWKEPGYFDEIHGTLSWNWKKFRCFSLTEQYQLEVIWMICVDLFGDYGTSPRSGWIEQKEAFYKFVDDITETYRLDLRRKNESGQTGTGADL